MKKPRCLQVDEPESAAAPSNLTLVRRWFAGLPALSPRTLRPIIVCAAVLAIPIVPFVLFGEQLEGAISDWFSSDAGSVSIAVAGAAALAADIVAPTPSSVVCTVLGKELGPMTGAAVAWLGLTLGAVLGFALARRWGRPWVERLAGSDDLTAVEGLVSQSAEAFLALFRALPILAEASVLLAGATGLSWKRFLPPVVAANAGIAAAYAWFGRIAADQEWFVVALAASAAAPLLLALLLRRRLVRLAQQSHQPSLQDAE